MDIGEVGEAGESEDKNLAEDEEGEADQLLVDPPMEVLPLCFLYLTVATASWDVGEDGKFELGTAGAGEEVEVPDEVDEA